MARIVGDVLCQSESESADFGRMGGKKTGRKGERHISDSRVIVKA